MVICIAIIIAIVIVGGGFYTHSLFNKTRSNLPVATSTPATSTSDVSAGTDVGAVSATPITTPVSAGFTWKNYTDRTSGFSFKYPLYLDTSSGQHKATGDFDGLNVDSLFVASYPSNYEKNTNLTSASIFAGTKAVDAVTCTSMIYGNDISSYNPNGSTAGPSNSV